MNGDDAWLALWSRQNQRIDEALASLDAPIESLAVDGGLPWVAAYAPLATAGWVATVGEAEALRVVELVVEAVRIGEPVAAALASSLGQSSAQRLLGLPRLSDVMLVLEDDRLRITSARWEWAQSGWQPASSNDAQTVRLYQDRGHPNESIKVPASMALPPGRAMAVDAWPSYERSPQDNVWGVNN